MSRSTKKLRRSRRRLPEAPGATPAAGGRMNVDARERRRGPGRAEEEVAPLIPEEELVEEEEAQPVEARTISPLTFKVGEHVVEEVLIEGEDVSHLRCMRCGLTVPLTEAAKFRESPCKQDSKRNEERRGVCELCGREDRVAGYPVWDSTSREFKDKLLCLQCQRRYEDFYITTRPSVSANRKRSVKARHPLEGERDVDVAWFGELATFFAKRGGLWECPACDARFSRFGDASRHFLQRHLEKASRGFETAWDPSVGDYVTTWQGSFCPVCGLLLPSVEELRKHHSAEHGEVRA